MGNVKRKQRCVECAAVGPADKGWLGLYSTGDWFMFDALPVDKTLWPYDLQEGGPMTIAGEDWKLVESAPAMTVPFGDEEIDVEEGDTPEPVWICRNCDAWTPRRIRRTQMQILYDNLLEDE